VLPTPSLGVTVGSIWMGAAGTAHSLTPAAAVRTIVGIYPTHPT